eukprot:Clim_evm29s236 gene=Clim_evmTU29s236
MAIGKTVCVSGASGFIAVFLVKQLLERGYVVHGTVRSLSNANKLKPLTTLPGADKNLKLFEADLLKDGSFQEALKGCDGAFHTDSPFFFEVKDDEDAQKSLLDPAVQGTKNFLNGAAEAGVKRIVLTSSIAAVYFRPQQSGLAPDIWSDVEWMRSKKLWYHLSKTLAEREAWDIAKTRGLDLRVINPGMVLGPLLTPHLNTSHEVCANYLNGVTPKIPNAIMSAVDVRDVAEGHILAYEKETTGRHICVSESVTMEAFFKILRSQAGEHGKKGALEVARKEGQPLVEPMGLDNQKLRDLGVDFSKLPEMCKATVDALVEKNFLK